MVVPIAAALILLADPLIHAWLRDRDMRDRQGAVPIIQILAVAVAIRVGNATGTTLLKGAGEHRMLALVNLGTGLVNVVLSIALDRAVRPGRRRRRHADPDRASARFHPLPGRLPPRRACRSAAPFRIRRFRPLWPALVVGVVLVADAGSSHPARFWL